MTIVVDRTVLSYHNKLQYASIIITWQLVMYYCPAMSLKNRDSSGFTESLLGAKHCATSLTCIIPLILTTVLWHEKQLRHREAAHDHTAR